MINDHMIIRQYFILAMQLPFAKFAGRHIFNSCLQKKIKSRPGDIIHCK